MTRGAEQLRQQLAGHGEQKKFVERFNEGLRVDQQVDPPMVSRWCTGKRLPSPEHMARIEDLTGIPMRAWTESAQEDGGAAPAAE